MKPLEPGDRIGYYTGRTVYLGYFRGFGPAGRALISYMNGFRVVKAGVCLSRIHTLETEPGPPSWHRDPPW